MNGVYRIIVDGRKIYGSITKKEGKRSRLDKLRHIFSSRNNRIKAEFLIFFAFSHVDMFI